MNSLFEQGENVASSTVDSSQESVEELVAYVRIHEMAHRKIRSETG